VEKFSSVRYPHVKVNLKPLREGKKWLQETAAQAIGLRRGTYAVIEAGIAWPSEAAANKIAEVFNTSVKDIWPDWEKSKC
jgi:DNA-binding XRE family transcriptional regulator